MGGSVLNTIDTALDDTLSTGFDAVEVTPDGSITSLLHCTTVDYRVFRMRDRYSAPPARYVGPPE